MFLGRPTVSGLHLFLSGIWFSEDFQTAHHRLSGFDRTRFEQWIESRENPRRLSLSSFGLAAETAGSDAAGFELWFEWYDQFAIRGSEPAKNSEVGPRVEPSLANVLRPTDDVYLWLEHDSSIMLKAITRFGDPVELTAEDARVIAASLLEMAGRLESDPEDIVSVVREMLRRRDERGPTLGNDNTIQKLRDEGRRF